jgi:hypothetical protein
MPELTIVVNINGYWRDAQRVNMPESPGIYFVYESRFNAVDETIDLLRIIHIGEASDIRQSVRFHELRHTWLKVIDPDNDLSYSCTILDSYNRARVAAAFIFMHQPSENRESQGTFAYDRTTVISMGKTALLYPVITANRTKFQHSKFLQQAVKGAVIPARAIPMIR